MRYLISKITLLFKISLLLLPAKGADWISSTYSTVIKNGTMELPDGSKYSNFDQTGQGTSNLGKYVITKCSGNRLDKKGKLAVIHACGGDPGNQIVKKIWPKEKPFPSLHDSIVKYIKNNTDKEFLRDLKFHKKQKIKYILRALPNEISGGIATSLIFSAWNAAVYVNQISDEQIMNAERKKYYQKVVKDIVNKNKGLHFNNELFVIEKK